MSVDAGIQPQGSVWVVEDRVLYAASIGRVLRLLRGYTSQAALAARAGLSASTLSRFESGQAVPDLVEARNLARVLGVDLARLAQLSESVLRRAAKILQGMDAGDSAISGAVTIAAVEATPEEPATATHSA